MTDFDSHRSSRQPSTKRMAKSAKNLNSNCFSNLLDSTDNLELKNSKKTT